MTNSATSVWAVGDKGAIVHFGGVSWSPHSSTSPTKKNLRAIWASSPSNVWAVGDGGVAIRFDGSTWQDLSPPATVTTADLQAVWGLGTSKVYAGGAKGALIVFGKGSWTTAKPALAKTTYDVTGIWGTSGTNLYARCGMLYHFDGAKWTVQTGSATAYYPMGGIWGSSATDLFEVGGSSKNPGVIYHFNGKSWSNMGGYSACKKPLHAVGGASPHSVLAVGAAGTVMHYDGVAWYHLDAGTSANFNAVSVTGNHAFLVGGGGMVRHLVGWRASPEGKGENIRGIWGNSASEVFAVGDKSLVLTYDGASWSSSNYGTHPLNSVWTDGKKEGFAVGPGGYGLIYAFEVLRRSGKQWKSVFHHSSMGYNLMWGAGPRTVHGSDASNVWATGGAGGTGMSLRWDGSKWSRIDTGLAGKSGGPAVFLRGVWALGPSEVYATSTNYSKNNTVYRYNGAKWVSMAVPTKTELSGIWGFGSTQIFAVGKAGTILQYDTKWKQMTSNTTIDLARVWGPGATDLYAVGAKGTVMRYDGKAWRRSWSTVTGDLRSVWGSSATDVWIVGDKGRILHSCGK